MAGTRPDFTPLYYRIEESLRERITSGEFREGDRLPSETELAAQFRTTRVTVRQALTRLVFEGLIVREPGRGSFVGRPRLESTLETSVQQGFEEQMESRGAKVTFTLLAFEGVEAPPAVAKTLGLTDGAQAHRLERLRFVDDALVSYEVRYIRADLAVRIPPEALREQSAFQLMEVSAGVPIGSVAVTVRASAATTAVARKLTIAPRSPLLVREHVFYDPAANPMLCGEAIYRADKYQFSYTIRRTPGAVPPPLRSGHEVTATGVRIS